MVDPKTTSPRATFRDAYSKAKAHAVDRCHIEMRAGDTVGNAAILRCIASIEVLDLRHALNAQLRDKVKEACHAE